MKPVLNTVLDPTLRSNDAKEFENALRRRIVGQDAAVEKVVEIYQMFLAGLNAPGRPVGNLLFLGLRDLVKPVSSSQWLSRFLATRAPASRLIALSFSTRMKLQS